MTRAPAPFVPPVPFEPTGEWPPASRLRPALPPAPPSSALPPSAFAPPPALPPSAFAPPPALPPSAFAPPPASASASAAPESPLARLVADLAAVPMGVTKRLVVYPPLAMIVFDTLTCRGLSVTSHALLGLLMAVGLATLAARAWVAR